MCDRKLRSLATIRVVPNMCPDGAVMGHLRQEKGSALLGSDLLATAWPAACLELVDVTT